MRFTETNLEGAYLIDIEPKEDERGFFARTWCEKEFKQANLNSSLVQCNISYNKSKGTLRGMHYQAPPFAEVKLVRCIKGSIYDVIIDLRKNSRTYLQWSAFELSASNRKMLYIPEGFAHGFQTLEDETEILYQMSEFFNPVSARGIRWNDSTFNIDWPINTSLIMSNKDQSYEEFSK